MCSGNIYYIHALKLLFRKVAGLKFRKIYGAKTLKADHDDERRKGALSCFLNFVLALTKCF